MNPRKPTCDRAEPHRQLQMRESARRGKDKIGDYAAEDRNCDARTQITRSDA
jgi:hypothetical protein